MILTKNIMTKEHLSGILRAVARHLAAAGEVLITGRVLRDGDNDSGKTGKDGPKT
ncbi:MAG: hypothetical protein KJ757_01865 [Planctomycetes bacterium]|nr:hypothetical protein [Planctomycetota bacterium]MBU2458188.1 hypothetical protein [Planctomycetota bacterium]MBU2596297.1 hypothetical protein [Planctomycetota bacterium]